ncbi:E4 [Gammapapillomavirus 15]|uniref:E4 n=1 Tax=Gammapapillomavirus 15 TaxID=1513260 RepID=A0A2D2ALT2_9PAPI|nr:E4 [Gammapapillomavirus 15]
MIMILIMLWYIHNGTLYTIRICRIIGIKCKVRWTIMDSHILMLQEKKHIFCYFMKMQKGMGVQDNGL